MHLDREIVADDHPRPNVHGHHTAHEVGLDRVLAPAPIDQYGEANGARTAQLHNSVKGSTDGSARVQHIVHEQHVASGEAYAQRRPRARAGFRRAVVAKVRYVKSEHRHIATDKRTDATCQIGGEGVAAGYKAEHDERRGVGQAFDGFAGEAVERAGHAGGREQRNGRHGQKKSTAPRYGSA